MNLRRRPTIKITTFAYTGDTPPQADITIDTRDLFTDPREGAISPEWNGIHPMVVDRVMVQTGAQRFVDNTANLLSGLSMTRNDIHIAIGCDDGDAVSVVLANRISQRLDTHGYRQANVTHRDIDRKNSKA